MSYFLTFDLLILEAKIHKQLWISGTDERECAGESTSDYCMINGF